MHKPKFENRHFYHVYNRGVEKRDTFMDDHDRFRFIHDLYEFNDTAPAGKFSEVRPPIVVGKHKRDMLVKIHVFCLMTNHYHLILEQIKDGGIVQFMKKLGTGYAMYFNEKYTRVGPLFQGRFKAILVDEDRYLSHLSRYIHLNPFELIEPKWQEVRIQNWDKAREFLETYRWSSFMDYIGKKNFPSITSRDFIYKLISLKIETQNDEYKNFIYEFAHNKNGIDLPDQLLLE